MQPTILDFEQKLALIDAAIAAGEDVWIAITEAAHEEESDIDVRRWRNCDLAARVVKHYGGDAIGKFASDANLPARRAKEYRTMGTFYAQRTARAEFLADNPVITYSHLRSIARRADDETQAYAIAAKASLRSWTVEKTEYMLWRWAGLLGKIDRKKTTVKPITEFRIGGSLLKNIILHDVVGDIVDKIKVDGDYRVVVYEAQP